MKSYTFALAVTIFVQALSGGTRPTAAENRLEPQRLFSVLDLDTPGMEKVKAAVDAGDLGRAEEELLTYARTRENVKESAVWRSKSGREATPAAKRHLAIADDALKHLFGGHPGDPERMFPAHQFGEDVD